MNSVERPEKSPDEAGGLRVPGSKLEIFLTFSGMAIQGFGGVLPLAQRLLVEEKKWMTRAQFVESFAVAQILPGPNIMNLALSLGRHHFGLGGALAALAGLLAVPLLLIVIVASQFSRVIDLPVVQGALRGVGAVAAGLMAGTSLNLLSTLRSNPMGWLLSLLLAFAGFLAVAVLRWPLHWAILAVGGVGVMASYFRLLRAGPVGRRSEGEAR